MRQSEAGPLFQPMFFVISTSVNTVTTLNIKSNIIKSVFTAVICETSFLVGLGVPVVTSIILKTLDKHQKENSLRRLEDT